MSIIPSSIQKYSLPSLGLLTTFNASNESRSLATKLSTSEISNNLLAIFTLVSTLLANKPILIDNTYTTRKPQNVTYGKYKCKYGHQGKYCDPCGVTFVGNNLQKVVGGIDAIPHSWPAAVAITKTNTEWDEHYFCGGTLISRDTVLSAAHCFQDISINDTFVVYLGLQHQNIHDHDQVEPGVVKVKVIKILNHHLYDDNNSLYDIALLKLEREVALDKNIQLACLPPSTKSNYPTRVNVNAFAVGWGRLRDNGPLAENLQNVKIKLYDASKCEKVIVDYKKNWQTQICAGNMTGGKDTCQGDSGGGLYVQDLVNGEKKMICVGIVSYGQGCAQPNLPGIYTKVSSFLKWIDEFY